MYLNQQLVADFPITLRYGEERDRDYLVAIFSEVWGEIPENNRSAILSRGYGHIDVDVLDIQGTKGLPSKSGEIRLKRVTVDSYPRSRVVYIVAHQFARLLDEFENPNLVVRKKEPYRNTGRRIVTILERWGYVETEMEYTPADTLRIRAILGDFSPSDQIPT